MSQHGRAWIREATASTVEGREGGDFDIDIDESEFIRLRGLCRNRADAVKISYRSGICNFSGSYSVGPGDLANCQWIYPSHDRIGYEYEEATYGLLGS